ncbi:MAG TPA: ribosomal protein S18-alanine N-acetyltransferase [Pyrinomonadaceae bacterium]
MNVLTGEVTIELMSEHDLLEVVEIEEKSGLSRWGWAAYYAELQGANRELMLVALAKSSQAVERREIAGYIAARATAGELHINNVAVRDEYRRNGIGYVLLGRAIEQGKRMGVNSAFLEVRSGNSAAQALYKKCGFKPVARRRNYYSEPLEDAIVMNLIL